IGAGALVRRVMRRSAADADELGLAGDRSIGAEIGADYAGHGSRGANLKAAVVAREPRHLAANAAVGELERGLLRGGVVLHHPQLRIGAEREDRLVIEHDARAPALISLHRVLPLQRRATGARDFARGFTRAAQDA